MAYEEVTSPILTDATGQDIVDKLDEIAQNLQPPTNIEASDVSYDNTQSGMTATDVQDAVTELKSNLTQFQITDIYNSYSMAAASRAEKQIDLTSLGVSDVNDILAITVFINQPSWVICGLYYGTLTATSVSIGLQNGYSGTLNVDVTLRVWHR